VTTLSSTRQKRRNRSRSTFIATLLAVLALFPPVVLPPAWASPENFRVVAVYTESPPDVSIVIARPSGPSDNLERPDDVSVSVLDSPVPATVTPMTSPGSSVALVVDTAVPEDLLHAVQSGAAEFLLRLPTGAHSMVIATGENPRIAAPLAPDPVQALSAITALRAQGTGSIAAGVTLAAQSLADAPAGPRAIIVFNHGTDQGGPEPVDVARATSRAEAVVSVIQAGTDHFWPQVAAHRGVDVLPTGTQDVAQAFRHTSAALSNQYVVAFKAETLPTTAEVAIRTGDVVSRTVVQLPDNGSSGAAETQEREPTSRETAVVPVSAMAAGLLLASLSVVAMLHRRRRSSDRADTVDPLPGARPTPTEGSRMPKMADRRDADRSPGNSAIGSPDTPSIAPSPQRRPPAGSLSDAVSGLRRAEEDLQPLRQNRYSHRPREWHPLRRHRPALHHLLPGDSDQQSHRPQQQLGGRTAVEGAGNAVVQLPRQLSGPTVVHITGNTNSRYFGVRTVETNHSLVNTTDPYDGVRLLDRERDTSTALRVQASGVWTIEIRKLSDAPSFDASYTGNGDAVIRYTGNGSTVEIIGNDACGYFGIRCITTHGIVRLVSTTYPHSKTYPLSAKPQLFEIEAVGSWTITVK
jgi:hypothetical protein